MREHLYQCRKCGCRYWIRIGTPARAPHGPDKSCSANDWVMVTEENNEDLRELQTEDR